MSTLYVSNLSMYGMGSGVSIIRWTEVSSEDGDMVSVQVNGFLQNFSKFLLHDKLNPNFLLIFKRSVSVHTSSRETSQVPSIPLSS